MSLERSGSVPFYTQLKQSLQREILAGVYAPGDPIPTELELCRQYEISRHTVRQALAELVKEGVIHRVPGKGSFVTRQRPRANMATGMISFLMADTNDDFSMRMLKGVEEVATAEGRTLTFGSCRERQDEQARLIDDGIASGAEGFIIMPVDAPKDLADESYLKPFARLKELGIPVVFIDRYYDTVDVQAVVSANFSGATQAIVHLAELGHRQIGFVSTDNFQTSSVADRYQGYLHGLAQAGLRPVPSWVLGTHEDGDVEALRAYLRRVTPSAVLALNDVIAAQLLQAAKAEGLSIPQDLSVVGFDDRQVASFLEVPLTTVKQFSVELGQEAARALIDALHGVPRRRPQRIEIPTELVVRGSTGPAPFRRVGDS